MNLTSMPVMHRKEDPSGQDESIRTFCLALAKRYHPLRITLFGSHAKGTAQVDSDVDLLIEMNRVDSGLTLAADMMAELHPRFAVDLLLKTPEELHRRLQMGDHFLSEAIRTGKVIYEAADT